MTTVSENNSPHLTLVEQGSAPDTPAAGTQKLFIDEADHLLKMVDEADVVTPIGGGGSSGVLVQKVVTETGASATGTTLIPLDDTIPQNTEGDEYMTVTITPTDAANELHIEVVFFGVHNVAAWIIVALFQDSTSDALATGAEYQNIGGGMVCIKFFHKMVAGTTSATTFKVRAGGQVGATGTTTFNGTGGARYFGGVMASSITVEEIVP